MRIFIFILFFSSISMGSLHSGEIPFPSEFWWGVSLSAHQAEGHNDNSWTEWEPQINTFSGIATDFYNRYKEDFDNLQSLNANTFRMSIEWSRLESAPGQWSESEVRHYREMILDLKARKIRPVVCLFHFTLPKWVEAQGGFENPKMIEAYVAFVKKSVASFGDLVTDWFTMNEPMIYALSGYAVAVAPPGHKDVGEALRVNTNLLKAHALAYHAIKNLQPTARVSFAQHMRAFSPKDPHSLLDRMAAYASAEAVNWYWYEALTSGRIKLFLPTIYSVDEKCEACLGALDYVAMNYYSRDIISFDIKAPQKIVVSTHSPAPVSDMGWEIYPQGLGEVLQGIKDHGLSHFPVLIAENGIADSSDKKRPQFIYDHVKIYLEKSMELGLKPMGYLHWSLTDNFEWNSGFTPRFGLFSVDYNTLERHPRGSALYFGAMGAAHALFAPPAALP